MATELENLLQKVDIVASKHNERMQWKRQNGDFFNVFDIIHVGHFEAKTHSPFLAELLRPNGSHGCGEQFLQVFLELFSSRNGLVIDCDDISNATVCEEVPIDDGRMDIVVTINKTLFIIENKIYANDQEQQIFRYHNYAKKEKEKENGIIDRFYIIYLTLNGDKASEGSAKNLTCGKDYFAMSYKEDIAIWIEKCISIACQNPKVRETLIQYKNLINQLTGDNDMNDKEKQEMFEIMLQHLDATTEVYNMGSEAFVHYAFGKYVEPMFKDFAKENSLEYSINCSGDRICSFAFKKTIWKYKISISGCNDGFFIGITNPKEPSKIGENLSCFHEKKEEWWPYGYSWLDNDYRYFCPSVIKSFINGKYVEYIEEWVERIINEIDIKKIIL